MFVWICMLVTLLSEGLGLWLGTSLSPVVSISKFLVSYEKQGFEFNFFANNRIERITLIRNQ